MLSTKNNNNNSSLTANTIKCNSLEADNIYNKTEVDALIGEGGTIDLSNYYNKTEANDLFYQKPYVNTINDNVNNLTSKIQVNQDGVDITSGSLYFNGNKLFSEKVETTTNRFHLSLYIDQF